MEASLTNILELALQQGIWAALYIYLFFRMLSENKEREDKYQTIIDRLSGNIEQGIAERRRISWDEPDIAFQRTVRKIKRKR